MEVIPGQMFDCKLRQKQICLRKGGKRNIAAGFRQTDKGQGMVLMPFTFIRVLSASGNHLLQNVCVCVCVGGVYMCVSVVSASKAVEHKIRKRGGNRSHG